MSVWSGRAFALCLFSLSFCLTAGARTFYVVPAGTPGNTPTSPYTSEATAANELGDVMALGLGLVTAGDIILVRKGTYYPTKAACPSSSSGDGYGVTIRSYDPDDPTKTARDETIIDGSNFTEVSPYLSLPTYSNYGSADQIAWVEGLTFTNFTTGARGAAINISASKRSIVTNCTFASCSATERGGGIYANIGSGYDGKATVEIVDCRFVDCSATGDSHYGGGAYGQRNVNFRKCLFKNCSAPGGGGHLYLNTRCHADGCTFTGTASGSYGQVVDASDASVTISNCVVTGVSVVSPAHHAFFCLNGGGLDKCIVTNCTPTASILMFNGLTSDVTIPVRNCLFAGNTDTTVAPFKSYNSKDGTVLFENCTIVGRDETSLFTAADNESKAPSYVFRNSIVIGKTNFTTRISSENSYFSKTLTVDTVTPFADPARGNWRLRRLSDLVDAGAVLDWHAGATDLDGRPRTYGAAVDLGCYERQTGDDTLRAVATAAEKTGDWANAFVGLQDAIDASAADGTVLAKSGTYAIDETLVISNRSLTLKSANATTGLPDRDGTILDGQKARRILSVGQLPQNYKGIPTVQRTVRIEGFTFKDGQTLTGDGQYEAGNGGGLYLFGRAMADGLEPSSVVNCRFTGCKAANGGGVAQIGGVLNDCLFDGNVAENHGGGAAAVGPWTELIRIDDSYLPRRTWYSPEYIDCTFTNNTAAVHGGGFSACVNTANHIYMEGCLFFCNSISDTASQTTSGAGMVGCYGSTVTNCTFAGNSNGTYAAISVNKYTHLTDCTFRDNAGYWGEVGADETVVMDRCRFGSGTKSCIFGGVTVRNTLFEPRNSSVFLNLNGANKSVIDNCTFAAGSTIPTAVGSYASASKSLNVTNCIFYSAGAGFFTSDLKATVRCDHCCFSSALPAALADCVTQTNCFVANPKFTDAEKGDWTLRHSSPCVDRGAVLDWMTEDAVDLAGNDRVLTGGCPRSKCPDALPDLGCFEQTDKPRGIIFSFR